MTDDYEVGYGKPPKEHQFKAGQSGNPRGRPKKDYQDVMGIYKKLLGTYYEVRENGKLVKKTGLEIIAMKQMQKAMMGDPKSAKELLDLNKRIFLERATLDAYIKWIRIWREEDTKN